MISITVKRISWMRPHSMFNKIALSLAVLFIGFTVIAKVTNKTSLQPECLAEVVSIHQDKDAVVYSVNDWHLDPASGKGYNNLNISVLDNDGEIKDFWHLKNQFAFSTQIKDNTYHYIFRDVSSLTLPAVTHEKSTFITSVVQDGFHLAIREFVTSDDNVRLTGTDAGPRFICQNTTR